MLAVLLALLMLLVLLSLLVVVLLSLQEQLLSFASVMISAMTPLAM